MSRAYYFGEDILLGGVFFSFCPSISNPLNPRDPIDPLSPQRAQAHGQVREGARPGIPPGPQRGGPVRRGAPALRRRLHHEPRRRRLHVRRGHLLPRRQAAPARHRAHAEPGPRGRPRVARRRHGQLQEVRHRRRARPGRTRLHVRLRPVPLRRPGRVRRRHVPLTRAQRHQPVPGGVHPRRQHEVQGPRAHVQGQSLGLRRAHRGGRGRGGGGGGEDVQAPGREEGQEGLPDVPRHAARAPASACSPVGASPSIGR